MYTMASVYHFIGVVILGLSVTLVSTTSDFLRYQTRLTNNLTYDELHESLVRIQVLRHKPAQKSLHTRRTKNLNGLYDFCLDNEAIGFTEWWPGASLRGKCRPENFYRMPVPSAFNEITSNARVKNYVGWFWYQRSFRIERNEEISDDDNLYLQFDSVNYLAMVWLQQLDTNKTYALGSHVGGYLPFIFNLTDQSVDSKEFRLTVALSNRLTEDTIPSASVRNLTNVVGYELEIQQPDFDFFHFAGILGNVNLIVMNRVHIVSVDRLGDQRSGGNVPAYKFRVCTSPSARAHYQDPARRRRTPLRLKVSITDQNREQLSHRSFNFDEKCLDVELDIRQDANRSEDHWTPSVGNPNDFTNLHLARFELVLGQGESCYKLMSERENCAFDTLDVVELRVGQRKSSQLVNRQSDQVADNHYKLRGFGMHQEELFSGRTMSQAAIMKDIYLLKQVGANVIRTSHYPYSTEYLEACDENGISVIAECQAVGLKSFSDVKLMLHKQMLLEMMQRDNHHPSIIMWSIANEPSSQLEEARAYFESLVDYLRNNLTRFTIDADRPLTAAIAQSHQSDRIGDLLDVIMVNRYLAWYDYIGALETIKPALTASLVGWSERYGKPLIMSEFGAEAIAGLHSVTGDIYSEEYQSKLLMEHERTLNGIAANASHNRVNLWGSMIWNFADFSTDISITRTGNRNRKGIFTQNREPKESVSFVSDIYLNRAKASHKLQVQGASGMY